MFALKLFTTVKTLRVDIVGTKCFTLFGIDKTATETSVSAVFLTAIRKKVRNQLETLPESEQALIARIITILTVAGQPTIEVPHNWYTHQISEEVKKRYGTQPNDLPHNWCDGV